MNRSLITEVGNFDYYYGFKTEGPLGHFTLPENTNEELSPLVKLDQYIDYQKSYPEASGNLLSAKPIFYGFEQCKINLYFKQTFPYHFFQNWRSYKNLPELNGEIELYIKDPVDNTIIEYPLPSDTSEIEIPHPSSSEWEQQNDPRLPLHIQAWNNIVNFVNDNNDSVHCDLTLGEVVSPQAFRYETILTNLKPSKLYTVIANNKFEGETKEIHRYAFQTSRYKNFREQVESYQLTDGEQEKMAVFFIDVDVSQEQLDAIEFLVRRTMNSTQTNALAENLETEFLDPFDRIWEGVLGQKPLDPPQTTEFNILRNTNGDRIAIIIRNPEPFNHPKIPVDFATENTVFVANSSGGRVNTYKTLLSKDYANAFIFHDSQKIPNTIQNLRFKFQYIVWGHDLNEPQYIVEESDSNATILTDAINVNS